MEFRLPSIVRGFVGLVAWALALPALAESNAPSAVDESSLPSPVAASAEGLRTSVRETALWLARGVDSWFGDKPFSEGGSVSEGRLGLGFLHRPDGNSFSVRFNARFRLPNAEDKAYLFVGRDNPQEVISDQPGAFTRPQRLQPETSDDTGFFAGIGVLLRESTDLRVGFRGGLKPYVQLRYRQPVMIEERRLADFRQTFFWTVDDHLGSTTALSIERAVHADLAVRWLVSGTVTQATSRLGVSSTLGAYQLFGHQRQLALEIIATAAQHTGVALTDYGLQGRWKQPVHADWLVGEVLVGYFWPRPDDSVPRNPGWAAGLTLTLHF